MNTIKKLTRPFLRALYAAILANAHLRRHQDAIMLIEKILDYNPEDNHGARLSLIHIFPKL